MKLQVCPDLELIKFRVQISVSEADRQSALHSSALLSSAVLPRSHCLQDVVIYTVSKSLSGTAILPLVVKVRCNSTASTGQNIKGNNSGCILFKVLLTEKQPTSSWDVVE